MNSNDTFITRAMLSAYLDNEKNDYLNLLIPFVLNELPKKIGAKIEIDAITKKLNEENDLELKYKVVEKILQRLSKKDKYVLKERNLYYVKCIYDDNSFREKKSKIKQAVDNVTNKLYEYLQQDKLLKRITLEDAAKYLSDFLETYNYTVYENVKSVSSITLKNKIASQNYHVAQFILKESAKKSIVFDNIIEIIKGFLACKAIYYFMNEHKEGMQSKLKGTIFYLDTRLLIDALGFNLKEEQDALNDLIELIRKNGGYIKTFTHYVAELQGILYKYKIDVSCRPYLDLNFLYKMNKVSSDIDLIIDSIDLRLSSIGIITEDKPYYDNNIASHTWHIDYTKLKNELNATINYKDNDSLTHDADTIEAIAYMRRDIRNGGIENCKAIFVTKNIDIVRVSKKLYSDIFNRGQFNYAITDVDLTALLWLSSYGKNRSLPQMKLMENVYAACCPTTAVMDKFLETINKLTDSKEITETEAILLRSKYSTLESLTELSRNDYKNVTEQLIIEVKEKEYNREKERIAAEFQQQQDELAYTRQNLDEEKEDLMKKYEIIEHDTNTNKQEARKIEEIKQKNRDNIINRCTVKACNNKKIFKICIFPIVIVLSSIVIAFFTYATYILTDYCEFSRYMANIFISLTAVIGIICDIIALNKYIYKKINAIAERIYDITYSTVYDKYKDFLID